MYIGLGTLVVILIIVLIIYFVRRPIRLLSYPLGQCGAV